MDMAATDSTPLFRECVQKSDIRNLICKTPVIHTQHIYCRHGSLTSSTRVKKEESDRRKQNNKRQRFRNELSKGKEKHVQKLAVILPHIQEEH